MRLDFEQVRTVREGRVGHLSLDRVEAINALTPTMADCLGSALDRWRDDPRIEVVLLDGRGDRGFCAGGDIKFVHTHAGSDPERVRSFWRAEYRLDAMLASFPKPVVTVAHGITMGGGVGLASHASHRIVTPSVRFAMPETLIGLCPDVAGLHLLARAPGRLGVHAAVSGCSFGSGDALAMGFADAVVSPERLRDIVSQLNEDHPDAVLARLHSPTAAAAPTLLPHRGWVDDCYRAETLEGIIRALAAHADPDARSAAEALSGVCPTAAVVTLSALRNASRMSSMQECLAQDFRVSSRLLLRPDLAEGIRARVIDKDRRPRWSPATVSTVSDADVARCLAPFDEATEELWTTRVTA